MTMEERPPLIDVKKTIELMGADAADPSPGAPVPPQAAETLQPPPAATATTEKRGRGRPRGSSTKRGAGGKFASQAAPENSTAQIEAATDDDDFETLTPKEVAEEINNTVALIGWMIGGDDALPVPQEEKKMNRALVAYLKRHPDFQVRPEILLVGAYLPYFGRAMFQPTARQKIGYGISRLWSGIKSAFGWIFRKKGNTIDATATYT